MGKNEEASLLLRIKTAGQEALDKVVFTFGDLINLAKQVASALVEPIMAFKEAERTSNQLTQAMVNAGVYTKDLKDKYVDQANALEKLTTFEDDHILKAMAAAQQYLKNTPITQNLTKAILDYAAATGTDAVSAAEKIGKSIGTSTNALAREGIQLGETMTQKQRLEAVTRQLTQRYGGQAEAMAEGLGVLDQIKNAYGNILEVLGEKLAPIIQVVGKAFLDFTKDQKAVTAGFDGITSIIRTVMGLCVGLVEVFEIVGKSIGSVLGTTIGAIAQVLEGNFKQAWTTIKTGYTSLWDDLVATTQKYDKVVSDINATSTENKIANTKREKDLEKKAEENAAINKQILADELAAAMFQKKQDEYALNMAMEQAFHEAQLAERERFLTENTTKTNAAQSALIASQIAYQQKIINNEKDLHKKSEEMRVLDDLQKRQKELKYQQFELELKDQQYNSAKEGANALVALQNAKSKEQQAIGKAAALVQIGMSTYEGSIKAYSALAGIPYVGPALGIAAAAALTAYGMDQASKVSGLQLAEGGIVKARPGGIQATIGEGGQDEAVIPLDRAGDFMPKNNITIVVNGGLMGDEQSARQFALAIDSELLKLRKNNESISFDSGVV